MIFPQEIWQETTSEQQGIDSEKLHAALTYFQSCSGNNGIKETIVARNGYMIYKGSDINRMHGIWSCSKSIVSTILGLLIDDGKCTLETKVAEFVPELSEQYAEVTLRHFATMTSGYDSVGGGNYGQYELLDGSSTPYTPAAPFFAPGEKYNYWDNAMRQFGHVLTRIAGEPLDELFQRRIAEPIGMHQVKWSNDIPLQSKVNKFNIIDAAAGVNTTAEQLTRFGHLFLNKGNWNGRQLISKTWVEQAVSAQVPADLLHHNISTRQANLDGRGVYGFNWWVNGIGANGKRKWPDAPAGTFYASGVNSNFCFVIPEWQMVIVRTGTDGNLTSNKDEVLNQFFRQLSEAVSK